MKKLIYLILTAAIITSACTQKDMTIDENSVGDDGYSQEEGEALERLNQIKNGATPKVKPTGENDSGKTSAQAVPQPPKPSYASSIEQLGYEDLHGQYKSAIIKTNKGNITVEFYGDDSPLTVNNFLNLAKNGFYDGTRFHRVINDFMVQAGDPYSKDVSMKDRWGTGGPEYRFIDEVNNRLLVKGSFAMANAGPNTNGSQFFIVTKEATPWLDGKHTNFGQVVSGMDVVEAIEAAEVDERDRPVDDVIIEGIELIEK